MPTRRNPRRGTMQFWHRKRAPRMTARVRTWAVSKEAKALGFCGYKAGMTHVLAVDNKPTSPTKNEEIAIPVTIIETPPLRVIGYKTLKQRYGGRQVAQFVWADKQEKTLSRSICVPKQPKKVEVAADGVTDVRLLVQTQPHLINLKKTPDIVELAIGGAVADQLAYAQKVLGTEISAKDVLVPGQQLDTHSVTKGHGHVGPVGRFGIMIRQHKAEKTKRGPATLGPWGNPRTYRVAHAGQTGFHRRTENNKWLLKIDAQPQEVTPSGGIVHYGVPLKPCILIKGSVGGACRRLITLTPAIRPMSNLPKQAPEIKFISKAAKQ